MRGFFESPYFELAKSLPTGRWLAVDDLDQFHIVAYSLARKHGDELQVDPDGVARSRATILERIAAMAAALVDGDAGRNEAREEDFPMTENHQNCKWCQFRGICWPGGELD